MTHTDPNALRQLLDEVAKSGDRPSDKRLLELPISEGNITERKRIRATLRTAANRVAQARQNGEPEFELRTRIEDLVERHGAEVSDPAALAAGVSRELRPWKGERSGQAKSSDPTALTRLASELSHSIATREPISNSELAHLQPSADMSPAQQSAWRAGIRAASNQVAELAQRGRNSEAHRAARDLAGTLTEGLAEPEHVDPHAAARRPDGTYDPRELMKNMPRAL